MLGADLFTVWIVNYMYSLAIIIFFKLYCDNMHCH